MACFRPLLAYRSSAGGVVFSDLKRLGSTGESINIACGQCIGCRLERSRHWAVRCDHERSMWKRNEFVTLTYRDECLPVDGSLVYRDFQLFMKRLRKWNAPNKVRFFMCGEYGEENLRPHYHALLFNVGFDDRVVGKSGGQFKLYRSAALAELWGFGNVLTGDVTFKSAAYVARYIVGKVTGTLADAHYLGRLPEFCHMSLKPGIGAAWLDKFRSDVYPRGFVVVNGKEVFPPKYYDRRFEKMDERESRYLKSDRENEAYLSRFDRTEARLKVREAVVLARVKMLKRPI